MTSVVVIGSVNLDIVASEKVVDAKHTTITPNLIAIEEMRRILYLHAGLKYKTPATNSAAAPR